MIDRCLPPVVLVIAGTAALALSSAVYAQDIVASSGSDDRALGEIVVTAQRYRTDLQKTPAAVTAFDANSLQAQHIDQVRDLTGRVPNLEAPLRSNTQTNVIYFIRGIGNKDTKYDPAVGVYIDDVYIPRSWGTTADISDLQAVEVLRGPQGTLYGRNNTGGAVKFTTRVPEYQFGGTANFSGGTDADFGAGIFITGPIVDDQAAFSLAYQHHQRDGFTHDVTLNTDVNNIDLNFLRAKLRFDPTEKLRIVISGDGLRDRSTPTVPTPKLQPDGLGTGPFDPGLTWVARKPEQHLDVYGLSLTADYALATSDTLRFISSYRGYHGPTQLFYDGGSSLQIQELQDNYHQHDWTEELTYTGRHGPVDLVAGIFAFGENFANDRYQMSAGKIAGAGSIARSDATLDTHSYAGYGQATIHLAQPLSVTLGGRYTRERRSFTDNGYTATVAAFPALFTPVPPTAGSAFTFSQSKAWHSFSPKVSLQFEPTGNIMAYISWSRGFRAGAYDVYASSLKTASHPVDPERMETYEAGIKAELLDHSLRINLAGFHNNWDDLQISAFDPAISTSRLLNAGTARTDGFELEAAWRPMRHIEISESLGYLSTGYTRFNAQLPSNPANATTLLGKRLPLSPHWSSNTAIDYEIQAGEAGQLRVGANLRYISSLYLDVYNSPQQYVPNEYIGDAAISFTPKRGKWWAEVRVTNFLDKRYDQGGAYSASLGPRGSWYLFLNEPREVLATVRYDF